LLGKVPAAPAQEDAAAVEDDTAEEEVVEKAVEKPLDKPLRPAP
jgi:hypothetical protein